MISEDLNALFRKDLQQLIKEIRLYENELNIWISDSNITNSAGNLTLHLIGNLNHFIGHTLGNSNYTRDRKKEFSDKNVDRDTLIAMIESTIVEVEKGLISLNDDSLLRDQFPVKINNNDTGMLSTLIHLHSHLNYHLGQINYHRRFFDQ